MCVILIPVCLVGLNNYVLGFRFIQNISAAVTHNIEQQRRLFGNVSLRDPMHNSGHYMVLGYLHIAPLREHVRYLMGRTCLPLLPPTTPTSEDGISLSLHRDVPKLLATQARKNVWILAATWILVDKRVSERRYFAKDQVLIWRLGHDIKTSLRGDRRRHSEEAGEDMESLMGLDPLLHR